MDMHVDGSGQYEHTGAIQILCTQLVYTHMSHPALSKGNIGDAP